MLNHQAEEIVDVINDLQQAMVSSFSKCFFLLPIFSTSEMLLQYTAMFLKDPSEKEEKMKEVVGNTLPQGLLRSSLKSHF